MGKRKQISFKTSKADSAIIKKITARAASIAALESVLPVFSFNRLELEMDLVACHANGCPMDFAKVLAADEFNFRHDVWGISNNINRETGELMNCFLPRFSRRKAVRR